jgi:2-polyprenyl-3-methyl-5-hydroxy-6-metoxy-1,4-benzoquinol methylase
MRSGHLPDGILNPMDNVFRGETAVRWHQDIGPYGDKARVALLNHIIVRVLNKIAATPVKERTSGPKPHIRDALDALNDPKQLGEQRSFDSLRTWHADVQALQEICPDLEGARLWDMGCGNGYLGAWLGTVGVDYLGVEPSPDLIEICMGDRRLQGASIKTASLADFCEGLATTDERAPTMITIVSVLEHMSDPEADLKTLAQMLYDQKWHDVPILVATLDPDFLLPGRPTEAIAAPTAMPYGDPDLVSLRDPAHWEEMFARAGLWVLEQRPIHLDLLPEWLANELRVEYSELHNQTARAPVRQGPFYLWLLSRARGTLMPGTTIKENLDGISAIEMKATEFAPGESMALMGNLGIGTHRVEKGHASFDSPLLQLNMEFGPEDYFGQLELSGNYVASRVLGAIRATGKVRVLSAPSAQIKQSSLVSERFTDKLFLSLLSHLDSVRFSALVTPQRISPNKQSRVLGGNLVPNWVRNYAGALLQRCADTSAALSANNYRSRLVVELGPHELAKIIHGRRMRAQDSHRVVPSLVQAGVVDSFSAILLEDTNIHQKVEAAAGADANLLHIGWLAARYLAAARPAERQDADLDVDDDRFDWLSDLAVAISAMLGRSADVETFRDTMNRYVASERHNAQAEGPRRSVQPPRRGPSQIRNYICNQMFDSDDRVDAFLKDIFRFFNFHPRDGYETAHYLSDLVVVRDIWALLACVADDPELWSFPRAQLLPKAYILEQSRSDRIIAYLQDCISYIGTKSGLAATPW